MTRHGLKSCFASIIFSRFASTRSTVLLLEMSYTRKSHLRLDTSVAGTSNDVYLLTIIGSFYFVVHSRLTMMGPLQVSRLHEASRRIGILGTFI